LPNEEIEFSFNNLDLKGEEIKISTGPMGVIIIKPLINGREYKCVFDTGAYVSYFENLPLSSFPSEGIISDFFPTIGRFEVQTHRVNIKLGNLEYKLICGKLPPELGMMLGMLEIQGVIGNEILINHKVGYFPRRGKIVIYQEEK